MSDSPYVLGDDVCAGLRMHETDEQCCIGISSLLDRMQPVCSGRRVPHSFSELR